MRWERIVVSILALGAALAFAFLHIGIATIAAQPLRWLSAAIALVIVGITIWLSESQHDAGEPEAAPPDLGARVRDGGFGWPVYAILGVVAIGVNYVLLRYFGTVNWPYLWPRPLVYVAFSIIAVLLLLRDSVGTRENIWLVRGLGLLMLFTGESYLMHAAEVLVEEPSVVGVLNLLGSLGVVLVLTLGFVNQFSPQDTRTPPPVQGRLPYVAAVVPTYGEPAEILERTIIALQQLEYPSSRLRIIVSDDSHRQEVRWLAARYGVDYHPGPQRDAKAGNLNSALSYMARHYPQAELILTQDADELIHPQFLMKLAGYFDDPAIAFVQTPKEALAPDDDPFGTRDRVFYDFVQPGRNGVNSAFACGSGVLWRVEAVRAIGGFATWNLVEDLTTSYYLHAAGYASAYHNEVLSIGLAPNDIPGLLQQRGTWAVDNLRLFLFDNPLFKPGRLTLWQRLQYLELGMFYLTTVFVLPLLMAIPLVSLATGSFVRIEGAALFPWMLSMGMYYLALARGKIRYLLVYWKYWIGHWPTYTRAFWLTLRSRRRKPAYTVTRKTRREGFYGYMLWPQFTYIALALALIVRALIVVPGDNLTAMITNVGMALTFVYLMSGICSAAFYGLRLPAVLRPRWVLGRIIGNSPRS